MVMLHYPFSCIHLVFVIGGYHVSFPVARLGIASTRVELGRDIGSGGCNDVVFLECSRILCRTHGK